MKPRPPDEMENAAVVPAAMPRVVTNFTDYTPPFDVTSTIEKMLATVPPKYLIGLSEVVLTNTAGLPRKLRRSMTRSRGRKVRQAASAGLYFQAWNGQPAWIKIYVDNTFRSWERGLWLKVRAYRDLLLGNVLFHEIGHHIHKTARPEFREREDVADEWKNKLQKNYFQKNHFWVKALLRLSRPLLKRFLKLYEVGGTSRPK